MNWMEGRRRRDRRRRGAGLLFGVLGGLGGALLLGALLPAVRVRSGSVELHRAPETIWQVLTDLDGMPRWRSDVQALERIPDLDGKPAWKEVGPGGVRIVQLMLVDPPRRLVTRLADPGGSPGRRGRLAQRTIELIAAGPGRSGGASATRVTVIEREEVGNLLGRVLTRLPIGRVAPPRYLRDLARVLGASRRQIAAAPE